MTYIIFGDKGSGAFSAEAALAEVGSSYEFRTVSLDKDGQHDPEYLKINPSGKMPALKLPDGEVITESAAILLTIADRHPDAGLLPPHGSIARADCYRWIVFLASEVYPMVEISDYPARFVPEGEQASALKEKVQERIRERLLILEKHVAGPWLLSNGFSAADIYAAMFSRWRNTIGKEWLEAGHIPKLQAIAKSLSERPRIAPVWQRHFGK